jgi:hypothetical protein
MGSPAWGRDCAREFAKQGFAVIRVRSCHWRDLKTTSPDSFRNPRKAQETEQQMICTIVMRDITCPMIQNVVRQMRSGALPSDLRDWNPKDWDLELPPGGRPCTPLLDVVAVTEASALLAGDVTPQLFRSLYRSYSHRLVWAGFNANTRSTGSKLLLGEPEDFAFLRVVFERLKVWHIDQQYKCFRNEYFTVVSSKLDILVGYRDHVSGCCDRHVRADGMIGSSFVPKPDLAFRAAVKKVQLPDSATVFIISSLRNYDTCRGLADPEDTVALRMWSYVLESDEEVRLLSPKIDEHREETRKLAVAKISKKAAAAARKAAHKACGEDSELMETLDKMLRTGEPLPAPPSQETKSDSVLLHIKNTGMKDHGFTEGFILAMIHRGLCVHTPDTGDGDGASDCFLSCHHHTKKQFQGLWGARMHFESFGFHRAEQEEKKLEDLAEDGAEEQQKTDDSQVEPLWVRKGKNFLQKMGWTPGEGLGRTNKGPEVFRTPGFHSLSFMETGLGAGPGLDAPIRFAAGEVLQTMERGRPSDDGAGHGPGLDAPVQAAEAPPPPDDDNDDESPFAGDGPPPLPPTSTPVSNIDEIDAFSFALLYIQWVAHGTSTTIILLEQWPSSVRQLQDHCNRRDDEVPELSTAINNILKYTPREWKLYEGYYIPELQRTMLEVWKAAFKPNTGFILDQLTVQLQWYYSLNYHTVENKLLCKFQIVGLKTQTPRLVFQAQGRLKMTRYKKVTKRTREHDVELRDEAAMMQVLATSSSKSRCRAPCQQASGIGGSWE